MTGTSQIQIFLEPDLRRSAENGQHNFINLLAQVVENARYSVEYCTIDAPVSGSHSLIHMKSPVSENGLLFRRVYHYPFWQIEAKPERWEWDVAKSTFDPSTVPKREAARFAGFWRKRLFGTLGTFCDGYVYIPLQGKLLTKRSFQQCSPIEMIEATLEHCGNRRVIAGMHPKETYSAAEIDALERLELRNHRFLVTRGDMPRLLARCDYVVTQNSGVAFSGYFLGKAALLFGKIDFHHIAVKADMRDLKLSFDRLADHSPAYAEYLWWFWQDQAINAGRSEAAQRISARLKRFGWPLG